MLSKLMVINLLYRKWPNGLQRFGKVGGLMKTTRTWSG